MPKQYNSDKYKTFDGMTDKRSSANPRTYVQGNNVGGAKTRPAHPKVQGVGSHKPGIINSKSKSGQYNA